MSCVVAVVRWRLLTPDSIPTIEPVIMRPMFAVSLIEPLISRQELIPSKPLTPQTSITFVSQASIKSGIIDTYNLRKRIEPVKNCRNISKRDMKFNDTMPKMKVDPERYVSSALCDLLGGMLIDVCVDCGGGWDEVRGGAVDGVAVGAGIFCFLGGMGI